ncbi:hypothetical protein PF011_g19731 [Phytophthora fragariae]|uniref:Uncharacterized protein n=1 Tax=Phytophthora fragariae TaxID=53985 RepID=A0A6A3J6D6_9STRA|nr:hypothetical protein PF011_g19731 [Phytophthora fragariae]
MTDRRTRSNGGRATWIEVTEGAPEGVSEGMSEGASEGARVMGSHAAGPAEVTDSVLEEGCSAWGRAARAPRRADGNSQSKPETQAVGAEALTFAAASTVDDVGGPAGDVATGAVAWTPVAGSVAATVDEDGAGVSTDEDDMATDEKGEQQRCRVQRRLRYVHGAATAVRSSHVQGTAVEKRR